MAYQDMMHRVTAAFQSGKTKNIAFRRQQLESLMRMYEENREAMAEALAADLRRPRQEAMILEVDFLINDLTNTLINLDQWTAPEKVNTKQVTRFVDISTRILIFNSLKRGSLTFSTTF